MDERNQNNMSRKNYNNQRQQRANNLPVPKKEKNNMFKKAMAWLLAGALAIGGIGIGLGIKLNAKDDGEETKITDVNKTPEETNDFWDELHVDISQYPTQSTEERFPEEVNKLIEGIDKINSTDSALNWFKNLYVNQYQGDEHINPYEISFVQSNNTNIIKAGDKYVTHGSYPDITKSNIRKDGAELSYISDVDVYSIRIKSSNEVIDCGASIFENGERKYISLIPGDSYNELKDTESTLGNLGKVPSLVMSMYDLQNQLSNNKGNGFLMECIEKNKEELQEEIKELYKNDNLKISEETTKEIEDGVR